MKKYLSNIDAAKYSKPQESKLLSNMKKRKVFNQPKILRRSKYIGISKLPEDNEIDMSLDDGVVSVLMFI